MDLSWVKWPVLILVVAVVLFGLSTPGVNFVYESRLDEPVGQDDDEDEGNEIILSRLAGYLLATFRYEFAHDVYKETLKRYPDGDNAWWNYYQLARCYEKMEKWDQATEILVMLRNEDGDQYDERVPDVATLNLRIEKLIEVHELDERKYAR